MNINPFDLLKNAQKIQEQMGSIQEKLGGLVVTGSSGGGMVEIDLNGRFEMTGIRIARESLDPLDIPLLQDLVKAAYAGAAEKIREALSREMGVLAGGIPGL
ncbi:MAG: YbaB/EbfC family nucleoid-associated protein [Spirochaetaceae bacterium]|jgi:DNA-binding YbaB/EbfC family protein|nr:YbaB/EbfC family nucleoid-associated protein [Spirochaetaceae bacterium]